jgi:hypothetical protein
MTQRRTVAMKPATRRTKRKAAEFELVGFDAGRGVTLLFKLKRKPAAVPRAKRRKGT